MNKVKHRETIIHTLGKLSHEEKNLASIQINTHLIQWLNRNQPKQLGAFVPIRNEPNIWPTLLDYAKKNSLFLPKFNPITNCYDWAPYKNYLKNSKFNIPEPLNSCASPPQLDACLVPALGIDTSGHRIGWGHGYFDRLLSTNTCHRIGIIFDCQRIKTPVAVDPWDIPLTDMITEKQFHIHF